MNLLSLYEDYVCVRVTDMRGVDLNRYAFDFDLTFGALLMHADGHVYHRYGGRDYRGASHWLSADSFESLLVHTLADHGSYRMTRLLQQPKALRIESLESFKKRDKGECIHCHSVYPAFYEDQVAARTWDPNSKWRHPAPLRIGMDLGREDQRLVVRVDGGSPAESGGLRVGDQILTMNRVEVMTASDVMYELDRLPWEGSELKLTVGRGVEDLTLTLKLEEGWRAGSALDFSWRPSKWGLIPAPGFGGPALARKDLLEAGLIKADHKGALPFAIRVNYLVTWGKNKRFGEAAAKAGLRAGDLVLGVAGRTDFASPDHLHAWWRLECKPGDVIKIDVRRSGEELVIPLTVIP